MPELPSGTVTFLFTDIEGSTALWERDRSAMATAVNQHLALLGAAIVSHHGIHFKTIGDAVQAAFPSVPNAVAAAIAAQTALREEDWADLEALRVRMAIHVGEATPKDGDYLAPCLNRLARLLAIGYGEQVLLSEAAQTLAVGNLQPGFDLVDLGTHRLRDLLQSERVYQLRGPGLVAAFPPLKSLDRHRHNLPFQPTVLIGREAEIASARALLATEKGVRLVTLTGPGGTGKTRIAMQVAAELVDEFADGVWFVPLAALADPSLVIPAIAQTLGIREVSGQSLLDTVQTHLQPTHTLLLLDNFEHLTEAATTISTLLTACPKLKALVTSREPLRIGGEREFPVPPLALPTARQARHLSVSALLEYPAIRLFVERAQAVKSGFTLSDENAADIVAVCLRLDGLPLAIELAAARIRVMAPAQLLARLDKRLKMLTGGSRDLPARQQTLRAAIEWSHDLLRSDEQSLFACVAVFAGGCTFEAIEAVCRDAADLGLDLLDGLDSLVQKSLLRQEDAAGEPRFSMLETIREFGLERLDTAGISDAVRRAHADYFLNLAEEAERELTGPEQISWLNQLETEHDNVRAALGWLDQAGALTSQLRLAGSLWRFWWVRGHLTEGRRWLERALTEVEGVPPAVRAKSLSGAGILAESQGDYDRAIVFHKEALAYSRQIEDRFAIAASLTDLGIIAGVDGDYALASDLHTEALSIWRELGDEPGMAASLFELGSIARNRGDYDDAADLLGQSLTLARKTGDASTVGPVLESLGILAFYREDYGRAAELYEESLTLWRALGDTRMIAQTLVNLGEVLHHQGDLDPAEAQFQEALSLFQDLGDKRGTAFALSQLGNVALRRKNIARATDLFTKSLTLREQVGDKAGVVESIDNLAAVACARGEAAGATRLFGATDALRSALGTPLPAPYSRERERILTVARNTLGETTFKQEWERGRTLPIGTVIAEAIALHHPPAKIANSPAHVALLR